MDLKALTDSVTSGEAFKKIGEQAGLTQEKAQEALQGVLQHVQAGTASAATLADDVAKQIGVQADQVKAMLPYVSTVMEENAAKATGAAKEALDTMNATIAASPLGGFLKGLDKDGDGNVLDDVMDSVKGLFGKK